MPSPFVRAARATLRAGALLPLSASALLAQGARAWDPQAILKAEQYVRPPEAIERIVLAPRTDISFDAPDAQRTWFLRTTGKDRATVRTFGLPHRYIAGLQVDERAARNRSLTTSTRTGLVVVNPRTGAQRALQVPAGASVSAEAWSPTSTQVAYIANFPDASYAYVADVATGRATQVSRAPLLATLVTELTWTADGRQLVAVLVPEGRGPAPTHGPNGIEDGPQVRLTGKRAVPQPVHNSLLEDPHDAALLRYHTTGQLAVLDVARRTVRRVGRPAMIRAVDVSPDGGHFRVTRMTEPFSYLVPQSAFGSVQELWDATGAVVATLQVTPLREEGRGGFGGATAAAGADTGKRALAWHPVGQGLVYLQSVFAAPGGNGAPARAATPGSAGGARGNGRPQPTSVRYVQWLPPYGPGDTKVLYEGGPQLSAVAWSADGAWMFVNDSGMVSAVRVSDPSRKHPLGRGVSIPGGSGGFGGGFGGAASADTVGTGGALVMRRTANGGQAVVMSSDGTAVFVRGERTYGNDWHRRAPRPWADRLEVETAQRTRVFDSPADAYERLVTALDDDHRELLLTRQSPTTIEDAWLQDASGARRRLTQAVDVAPEVTRAARRRIQVTRPRDGIRFWADIVLPAGWQKGGDMPGVIWFYPREYATAQAYERSKWSVNINQFPAVPAARPATATELWVAGGYVFVEPDVPIFGDSGRMNDNYTRDLRENLDAVLDAVVDSGFVRRDRMGIGGHSYGAFSTVNAMTLVPYFKAGIAGDGMYNRSLTPFGFQSERRNFFEAQDTYLDMSPFYRADRLAGALLLYHNLEDQNTGTAVLSSTRLFAALQGLGKEAALYLYPYEDHSVATYESDLDQWARWIAWFDVHLKGAGARPVGAAPAASRPAQGLAGTVVVTNKTPGTATIVDVASGRTLATLPTGHGPHEIVISRDGRTAVVTDYGTGPAPGSSLTVIDVPGLRVARTIPLGDYRRPHGIVLLPGDTLAAVTVEASRAVLAVDIRSGAIATVARTEKNGSHMVGVAADGRRAWTGDIGSNTVTELDLATGRAVRSIEVPAQPEAINVTPDGSEAWVGSNATGRVSVVDARTGTVATAAEGFGWPYRVLFTGDARLVLMPDYRNEELRVVERASRAELGRMRFPGGGPQGITLAAGDRYALVSMSAKGTVAIIDVAARTVVGELGVGETPDGVVYTPLEVRP